MIQFISFPRSRMLCALAGFAVIVDAGIMEKRQNPSFITTLPTVALTVPASRSTVAITTTAIVTPTPAPGQTTSNLTFQPSATPSPVPPASPPPVAAVSPLQGPYFGGVPEKVPDIPWTTVFLILFSLGAIINAFIYRSKSGISRWTRKDMISVLAGLFCLTRVLSCALRDIWAVSTTSIGVIFLALVSENAG